MQMAAGVWKSATHLRETIKLSLYDTDNLEYIGIASEAGSADPKDEVLCHRTLMFMWHLLANRCWSLMSRHSVPPDEYAPLASSNKDTQDSRLHKPLVIAWGKIGPQTCWKETFIALVLPVKTSREGTWSKDVPWSCVCGGEGGGKLCFCNLTARRIEHHQNTLFIVIKTISQN